MSYVRHVWVNDEDITHDKLNNIEEGVLEGKAHGETHAIVELDAEYMASSSKSYGYFVYAYWDEDHFVLQNDNIGSGGEYLDVWGTSTPYYKITPPMPIPPTSTIGLFFLVNLSGYDEIITSGNVAPGDTLYYSYGSEVPLLSYRISGDGSIKFVG